MVLHAKAFNILMILVSSALEVGRTLQKRKLFSCSPIITHGFLMSGTHTKNINITGLFLLKIQNKMPVQSRPLDKYT